MAEFKTETISGDEVLPLFRRPTFGTELGDISRNTLSRRRCEKFET